MCYDNYMLDDKKNTNCSIIFNSYFNDMNHDPFISMLESMTTKEKGKFLAILDNVQRYGLARAISMKWVQRISNHRYNLNDDHYKLKVRVSPTLKCGFYFEKEDDHSNNYRITECFKYRKSPKKAE